MKVCPVCKAEYSDDSKFCENDGSPLEDKDGKKCPHCGAKLKGKGKFCPECGKSTEVVEEKTEEKGCKCPKCGFESDEKLKFCPDCGYSFADGGNSKKSGLAGDFVLINEGDVNPFYIGKYPVTQDLYQSITGENPSKFTGDKRPVDNISWYDAIRFCNLLSEKEGKLPVYSVDETTDVENWDYIPHQGDSITGDVVMDRKANGYRLPTCEEFFCASDFPYTIGDAANLMSDASDPDMQIEGFIKFIELFGREKGIGIDDTERKKLKKLAATEEEEAVSYFTNLCNKIFNSGKTCKVGQTYANKFGIHDISTNVIQWCWDSNSCGYRGNSYAALLSRNENEMENCFLSPDERVDSQMDDPEIPFSTSLGLRLVFNA